MKELARGRGVPWPVESVCPPVEQLSVTGRGQADRWELGRGREEAQPKAAQKLWLAILRSQEALTSGGSRVSGETANGNGQVVNAVCQPRGYALYTQYLTSVSQNTSG